MWISVTLLMSACSSEVVTPPVMTPQLQAAAPPQRSEASTPERVHDEIVRWFSAAGYRGFQVEALAEHAKIESGLRPCASGAAGLRYTFQWGGTRLQRLHEFDTVHAWHAAVMALVITLMGFCGGLVMSAIKRDRGVKDWGWMIAGHGGMLDRLDSVIFAAPVFFHLTRYWWTE
jgi:hypothetical protein